MDARALVTAAAAAAHTARWDDVLVLARAAIAVDARSARAWSLAGLALEQLGDLAQARVSLERAVSLDDRDLPTALAAARVQAKTGARSAARALANYVLLHEDNAPALRTEAQALMRALDETSTGADGRG